jgi:hypothetical protein
MMMENLKFLESIYTFCGTQNNFRAVYVKEKSIGLLLLLLLLLKLG